MQRTAKRARRAATHTAIAIDDRVGCVFYVDGKEMWFAGRVTKALSGRRCWIQFDDGVSRVVTCREKDHGVKWRAELRAEPVAGSSPEPDGGSSSRRPQDQDASKPRGGEKPVADSKVNIFFGKLVQNRTESISVHILPIIPDKTGTGRQTAKAGQSLS